MDFDLTLEEKIDRTPPPLRAIIEDFRSMEPRERLESLLDFAMDMPDLPGFLHNARDQMEQVHECQTPIFVFADIEDSGVQVYIDVPKEVALQYGATPAIVQEGLESANPGHGCCKRRMTFIICLVCMRRSRRSDCAVSMSLWPISRGKLQQEWRRGE